MCAYRTTVAYKTTIIIVIHISDILDIHVLDTILHVNTKYPIRIIAVFGLLPANTAHHCPKQTEKRSF